MLQRKAWVQKAALLLGSTVFSLWLLELALRIVSPPSLFSPLVPLRPRNRLEIHTAGLKGVSLAGLNTTNRWGLRGDEPPSDWENHYTILTIGGSTTQCFFLDDHKTWPYLLQTRLRTQYPDVWVGNGGLDGHTTRGHLVFMEEIIPKIKPSAVIFLTGINDLGYSTNETERAVANANQVERTGWRYRMFARSRLLQVMSTWKQIVFDRATVVKSRETGHQALVLHPLPGKEQLPADLRSLLPALGEYRANIRRLIADARATKVRPVFLTQPLLFDDTDYWRGVTHQFYWMRRMKRTYSCATYWKLLDIYNKELLRTCREEHVECFDLASAIPHSDQYFYDSVHFNERGAALVAEKVSAFMQQRMPLPAGRMAAQAPPGLP